jgi:purine nucleosidase
VAANKELVLMDHDGGIDDFLSLALLLSMPHVETIGVVVTPADCTIKPAVSVTRKLMDVMGITHIPVAESTVRGLNPFPREWRQSTFAIDHLPVLNDQDELRTPLLDENGQRFMMRSLLDAPEPVTLLVTGPLTTVAAALDGAPEIETKIKRIVWMGGALNVPGNVDPITEPGQDGSAEWNVYWDPPAAHQVWQTAVPLVLCPLDITNHVPVTSEFIRQLGRQRRYPVSEVASLCYALVMKQGGYYFWDVLTTAYLGRPDLFTTRDWPTEIVVDGLQQGRTRVVSGGRIITALDTVDTAEFYAYMLAQWAR